MADAGGAGVRGLFRAAASGIGNALQAGAAVAPTDGGNTAAVTGDGAGNQNTFAPNGAATVTAGRDISFNTVQTGSTYHHQVAGYTQNDSSITHQLSQLVTSGDLRLQAGANLNLTGSQVAIGGAGQLLAGGGINIQAVTNEVNTALQNDPASKAYDKAVHRNQTVLGAGVAAAGDLTIDAGIAGSGSVNIAGSTLSAGGGVAIFATDNVNIASVQENRLSDTASTNSSSSVLRSTTTQQADYVASSMAIGSAISGKTVDVNAGKDINVRGSAIAGDGDVSLAAAGSVNIGAATSTLTEKHRTEVKESGFLSGGGFGISYGERTTTTEQERDATTQSGQSRSMVGSLGGTLNIAAGEAIRVSGSDLAAATDMTLDARSVSIDPGKDVAIGTFGQSTVQDGFTLKVGGTVIDTIQTLQSLSDAASQSKDGRVQALAAATAAMAAKSAASNVAKNGVNVSLSLTVGHSESEYTQSTSNLWNAGSTLNAGKDLTIRATGAGEDSNINVLGSTLSAQGTLTLKADNEVNLLAAQDQDSQHSDTRSMSAAVGVGASVGTSGTAIGVTGSLSLGRGKEDGAGTTQLNTHVTAGKDLVIDSGGDTNVKGAVASGKRVVANVGGDLNLESLQDTATFASKNQSISVSGTYGAGASMSASVSDSSLKSDYASVQEQSGIRAGADGFQLNVQGNTDLKGAVVSSAREAIEQNRNTLVTGTLTHSDIENHADYKGHSIGLSGSYGTKPSDDEKSSASSALPEGWKPMAAAETGANAPIALGAAGSDKSVTRSGISGGVISINDPLKQQQAGGTSAEQAVAAVNRNVSNEQDTSGALANGFDRRSIQAGFEIVAAFTGQATNLVADKARAIDAAKADADAHDTKADGLETIAESLPDGEQKARLLAEVEGLRSEAVGARVEAMDLEEKWGPGGAYRQVVSAFTAAASGNVAAAGSELVQSAVINWAQSQAARGIKQLADDYGIEEGTPAHAAMHALSSCVGASAAGGNCAASALAGASTTFVSALLAAQDDGKLTSEQKEARQALVQTLVTGAAAVAGADAAAANTAALIEMENNSNVVRAVKEGAEKAQALLTKSGKEGLEKLGKVLEKLEIKTLADKKEVIRKYLDEAGTRGGMSDTEIAALGVIYAANEVLFPTSILDAPGPGKLLAAVKKAGTLIKAGHRAEDAARIAGVEARAADSGTVALSKEEVFGSVKQNYERPATAATDRVDLRENLAARAGVPRNFVEDPSSIWGASLDDLKQTFTMDGATCLDSWDHVPIRSWPLFKARHVLRTLFQPDLSMTT